MTSANNVWSLRNTLKDQIRLFFKSRKYQEVETPVMVTSPGTEVHLNYFATDWLDHSAQAHRFYLRSSPELHLKKVLASGLPRIFEFAKCFRNNGELANWHNPEFTMLEWYETGISYEKFIDLTEELLLHTQEGMRSAHGDLVKLKIPKKFTRLTVAEAFQEFAGIKLVDLDPDLARKARAQKVISVNANDDYETAFFKVLLEKVEPNLAAMQAVVLYDYPASMAVLAKISGGVAKRFEMYINGIELCNAFEELLDADANRQRFAESNEGRKRLGKQPMPEDEEFYHALERGLPPCCGNALGFDRWLGLLVGAKSLADIMPFAMKAPD